jgi:hypothetical protein
MVDRLAGDWIPLSAVGLINVGFIAARCGSERVD